MESLGLKMLGTFQVTVGEQPVTDASAGKVRALLGYLALETTRPHARAKLADLLWPGLSRDYALDNLRKSLYRLRSALGSAAPGAVEVVAATRHTVQFVAPRTTVDVLVFQDLLAECQMHAHADVHTCDLCLMRLAQATDLYQGELLAGFELTDAPDFDEWLLLQRETLHQQALLALLTLGLAYEGRGELPRANLIAGRILAIDPYREEAHRQKMRLLAQLGLNNQAIEQYETCQRILAQDLGVEPDSATTELFHQIRAGSDVGISSPVEKAVPTPRYAWSNVPETGQIYGRKNEIARLTRWLTQEQCCFIAILGMGGIGKTTLAAAAVHAVSDQFDIVIWRSMINAPPLHETLRNWLENLSAHRLADLPQDLDAQLALLLEHLRKQRCLLVLDNLESIFQPDQAGQVRPAYQDYTQLMRSIAELQHRSCLLLTSRERPQGFARLEEDLPRVRTLHLGGLDSTAAQAMLLDRGLTGQSDAETSLVEQYAGNPLALKLVAETIHELFDGDIAAFLAAEAIIFDDIRAVLDWQFDRLPALEQEILFWLAVEREPVSIQTLRDNLAPARSPSELLAALRALQRRSLLERGDMAVEEALAHPSAGQLNRGFVLQNVLMEYLIDRLVKAACQEIEQGTLCRLHSHALMKVQAKEYVRQTQVRLILQPIAVWLQATLGKEQISHKIARLLDLLRTAPTASSGYAAGNLLNLLLLLEIDLTGFDFSHLRVWQADLRSAQLPTVNFAGADLRHTAFVDGFRMVYAVAYSPDGRLVAAGTNGGEIRLWRADNGQPIRTYSGHTGAVKSVAFSPDGKILASGDEGNIVRLWAVGETQTGVLDMTSLPTVLNGHSGRVTAVAFRPDGKMLASASVDHTVRLWDLTNGETVALLQGHEHWIWAIAFHPGGKTLASAGFDRSIRLWDVQTAQLRVVLEGHTGTVSSLAFSPNGDQLASGSFDRTVRLWDVEGAQILRIIQASEDEINCVAFSPDGLQLASGSDDKVTRIWDLRNGAIRHELRGHDDEVLALAYSPNGQAIVTGSGDQTVRLWDASNGRIRQVIFGHSQSVTTVAYHAGGKMLASGGYDGIVRLWNLDGRHIDQPLHGHRQVVRTVAMSPDGALLASGSDDQTIHIWDLSEHGRAHRRHILHGHGARVWSVAFSPDGTMLASGGLNGTVCLWDVRNGQLLRVLQGHESHVYSVQFSPDASLLASASSDESICLWDPYNARTVHRWRAHPNKVYSVAFSPDGKLLASGGGDGLIRVWNTRSPAAPRLEATLNGHTDRVHAVAISVDGSCLVSGGADYTVRIWDMDTYQAMRTLYGHTLWVYSVAISPDGNTIASGGGDDAIRLWDRQSGECLSVLIAPGPYAGMNITDVTGISDAEKTTLRLLGAVEV